MWLPSIAGKRVPQWLTEESSGLRAAVLVFAGLLCTVLLAYFVLVAPSAARLREREVELNNIRHQHAEAMLFKRQKPAFVKLMAGMPTQNDMPLLVKDLVQNARRLHLSVASIKYDMPGRPGNGLAMLVFSFPVAGRYPDVKRFIHDVETSGRLVGIKALKLAAEKGRVTMDMKLVTYVKGR